MGAENMAVADRCDSTMSGIRCTRAAGHPATSTNVYRDPEPAHQALGHRWTNDGADESEPDGSGS